MGKRSRLVRARHSARYVLGCFWADGDIDVYAHRDRTAIDGAALSLKADAITGSGINCVAVVEISSGDLRVVYWSEENRALWASAGVHSHPHAEAMRDRFARGMGAGSAPMSGLRLSV